MPENKVISNVDYTIINRSNYDIVKKDTKDIIDVPYFPAQNLVEVKDNLNLYNITGNENNTEDVFEPYIPFIDTIKGKIITKLVYRKDARYLFIFFDTEHREVIYRFSGVNYPQSRSYTSLTYNGINELWLFGGDADGTFMNDLWLFEYNTKTWTLINYSEIETSVNQFPSRRRKTCILTTPLELILFGGETNSISDGINIPLNDLWIFNKTDKTWTNLDPYRKLPHRQGNIVYVDTNEIKILIKEGTDILGNYEPSRIYTVNKTTAEVTYIDYTPPFNISEKNICLNIGIDFYIIAGSKIYKWDNSSNTLIEFKNGLGLYNDLSYIKVEEIDSGVTISYETEEGGEQETKIFITTPKIYNITDDTLQKEFNINIPPSGKLLHYCQLNGNGIFWYGGLKNDNTFNEVTYLFNPDTNHTESFTFPEEQRPTERLYPSMCYDDVRNGIWLFGGFDGSKYYNDLWFFNLNTKTYTKIHDQLENQDVENPSYPQPRYKAGITVVNDDYLYIIGGFSDNNNFNDFWKLYIPDLTWEKEYPIDDIPWGSTYFIFEWRKRLWLFNGDPTGIYRYYYSKKQFVKQPLLRAYVSDAYESKCNKKEFLNTPISIQFIDNDLFIYNSEIGCVKVSMEDKSVNDYYRDFSLSNNIVWIKTFKGIDLINYNLYYINISPLFSLTKNQIPHSFFHLSYLTLEHMGSYNNFTPYEHYKEEFYYIDASGLFQIQPSYIYLDKAELLVDGKLSFASLPEKYPTENLDNPDTIRQLTLDKLAKPTFTPLSYWFMYNKQSGMVKYIKGTRFIFKRSQEPNRIYMVYDSGNIVRFNTSDFTFFTYFTKLWPSSALAYDDENNVLYAFGGIQIPAKEGKSEKEITEESTGLRPTRTPYHQNGLLWETEKKYSPDGTLVGENLSHGGFLQFDLSINQFSISSLTQKFKKENVSVVSYDETRDYLVEMVNHYLNNNGKEPNYEEQEKIKDKLYLATQPIMDDLSQQDITYENGTRPSKRALHGGIQVDKWLFIFGGVQDLWKYSPCIMGAPSAIKNYPYNCEIPLKDCYKFNMSNLTWYPIKELPFEMYMMSCIPSFDHREIYIVGGCTQNYLQNPLNSIIVYNIDRDEYREIKGIPETFNKRIKPILKWLDEDRLLIQYGFTTQLNWFDCDEGGVYGVYKHLPVQDSWILDTKNDIIYQSFEDIHGTGGIVIKDSYNVNDNTDEKSIFILNPFPMQKQNPSTGEMELMPIINVYEWSLIDGHITKHECLPDSEIYYDFIDQLKKSMTKPDNEKKSADEILKSLTEKVVNEVSGEAPSEEGEEMSDFEKIFLGSSIDNSNYRFRYSWMEIQNNNKIIYIIGEKSEESGVEFIELMAEGYKEAHLRFWTVNLDLPKQDRYLKQIVYEYPLPIAPSCLAYDGKQYIYFIWNKYNIWRLNFKAVLNEPNGSWWYRIPPCINCTFLDIGANDKGITDQWSAFVEGNYLFLVSKEGKIAKMNTQTFTWYLDKANPPEPPMQPKGVEISQYSVKNLDDNEIYSIYLGGIGGKYINIYYKQWDNFFFDLRPLGDVLKYLKSTVSHNLYPCTIRRKRLYVQNHLGHILYSWIRIDGYFDLEYDLPEFYDGQIIKIYTDEKGCNQYQNFKVNVFSLKQGWKEIPLTEFESRYNDPLWDWDGEYTRRYVKEFLDNHNNVVRQYTKVPNNYIKINLSNIISNEPVSKIRVIFTPNKEEYNYITRINKIELIDETTELELHDSAYPSSALTFVHLEPVKTDDDYTQSFALTLENTASSTVKDVYVYTVDNKWIQYSLDGNSWYKADEKNPLKLADEIEPGNTISFYVRGMNIDSKPHLDDIVIKGFYAYT